MTIDETQTLNEEIIRLTASDTDVSTPHNQFVFETTSNLQWFGVYEDGRVYVKRVSTEDPAQRSFSIHFNHNF